MQPLEGKVAIVTGGGKGIGRGIALCLAQDGANVAIPDIDFKAARDTAREVRRLRRRALAIKADVSRPQQVQRMVAAVLKRLGSIDILVNNAGIGGARGWQQQPAPRLVDWDSCWRVNLFSHLLCARVVTPHMASRRWGRIINIASIGGLHGSAVLDAYCASKSADISLAQSLALQLGKHNITVNAVCPGVVETELLRGIRSMPRPDRPPIASPPSNPMGRTQTPEDIGWLVAFLASERARNITAQVINVDSGQVLHTF